MIERYIGWTIQIAALLTPMFWPDSVRAGDGTIVVVRQVSPRSAFYAGDNGPVRVSVNPSPEQAIDSSLGLDKSRGGIVRSELADADIAGVASGTPMHANRATSATHAATMHVIGGTDAGGSGNVARGALGGGGGGGIVGAAGMNAGGAVQRGTQQLNSILTGTPLLTR
jgi:hypothetical protein